MSISPISSLSIYEYYYSINRKKNSPIAKELEQYGIKPSDDDTKNIIMLQRAQALNQENEQSTQSISYQDRPWADLMNQLNISFSEDPKEDIENIKKELNKLLVGVADEELESEVSDLINYAEGLYVDYQNMNLKSFDTSATLSTQLNAIANYNIASI